MPENFYTVITDLGKSKITQKSILGSMLKLTKLKVGDGNGSSYNPKESQVELKNKVWDGNISSISLDEKNPNWIVVEGIIPNADGGFTIREVGVFDDEDNLIAIGKYPETYKPVFNEGSTKDLLIRMILEVSNSNCVSLEIDPNIVLATKKDIQVLDNKIKNIKVPVTSVNKKIGDIELKAEDIKRNDGQTVESSLDDKQSKADLNLKTKDKTVIGSINELNSNKVNNADFENYKKDYVANNAFGRTSGTSTNYTLTLNPAPTNYPEGMQVTIIPHINSTGSPYLNINGLGNSTLLNQDGTPVELKKDIPYSLVRVGNNFFINSGGGLRKGDYVYLMEADNSDAMAPYWTEPVSLNNLYSMPVASGSYVYWVDNSGGCYRMYTSGSGKTSLDVGVYRGSQIHKAKLEGFDVIGIGGETTLLVYDTLRSKLLWSKPTSPGVGTREPKFGLCPTALFVASNAGNAHVCLDKKTGDTVWSKPASGGYNSYDALAVADDTGLYFGNYPAGRIYKYHFDGTLLWTKDVPTGKEIIFMFNDNAIGRLYVSDDSGSAWFLDRTTGDILGSAPVSMSSRMQYLFIDEFGNIIKKESNTSMRIYKLRRGGDNLTFDNRVFYMLAFPGREYVGGVTADNGRIYYTGGTTYMSALLYALKLK